MLVQPTWAHRLAQLASWIPVPEARRGIFPPVPGNRNDRLLRLPELPLPWLKPSLLDH